MWCTYEGWDLMGLLGHLTSLDPPQSDENEYLHDNLPVSCLTSILYKSLNVSSVIPCKNHVNADNPSWSSHKSQLLSVLWGVTEFLPSPFKLRWIKNLVLIFRSSDGSRAGSGRGWAGRSSLKFSLRDILALDTHTPHNTNTQHCEMINTCEMWSCYHELWY